MRKFTTEDRSTSKGEKPDLETHIEDQSLQALEHLTDFTAEEFDAIANMAIGTETIVQGWIYIKRTN